MRARTHRARARNSIHRARIEPGRRAGGAEPSAPGRGAGPGPRCQPGCLRPPPLKNSLSNQIGRRALTSTQGRGPAQPAQPTQFVRAAHRPSRPSRASSRPHSIRNTPRERVRSVTPGRVPMPARLPIPGQERHRSPAGQSSRFALETVCLLPGTQAGRAAVSHGQLFRFPRTRCQAGRLLARSRVEAEQQPSRSEHANSPHIFVQRARPRARLAPKGTLNTL
jgi:hypothetical protein